MSIVPTRVGVLDAIVIGIFSLIDSVLVMGLTILYVEAVDRPLYPSCTYCTGITPPVCIRCLLAIVDGFTTRLRSNY